MDGIAGGNFLILAQNQSAGLMAAEAAVKPFEEAAGVLNQFGIQASILEGGFCAWVDAGYAVEIE